jgi:hypothetical protein
MSQIKNKVISLKPSVIFSHENHQYYLRDTETNNVVLLDNDVAVDFIKLCNGKITFEETLEKFKQSYVFDVNDDLSNDFNYMVTILHEEGFFYLN